MDLKFRVAKAGLPGKHSGMTHLIGRRRFLAAAGFSLVASRPALANVGPRALSFDNIHTGEKLKVEYWADGQYLPDALSEVNHVLRDFRSGEVHPIAPNLLETSEPITVISGYRSPLTNARLRGEHEHSGVASKSLHMQGMAIDIRVAGRSLAALHDAALLLRSGGVGYYRTSDFVHVDVGRVRTW